MFGLIIINKKKLIKKAADVYFGCGLSKQEDKLLNFYYKQGNGNAINYLMEVVGLKDDFSKEKVARFNAMQCEEQNERN